MIRALILISLLMSLAACASTPAKTPHQLLQENTAIVLGINKNYGLELLYGLPFVDAWTAYTELFFTELNGRKLNGNSWTYPDAIELPPGNHTLSFLCEAKISITDLRDKVYNYQIHVEAGHIYQMTAVAAQGGCNVSHVDITPEQTAADGVIFSQEEFSTEIVPTDWKLGFQKNSGDGYAKAFVQQVESANNWSKSITIQFWRGEKKTPLELVNVFQTKRKTQCPGTQFEIIGQKEDSVTYRFNYPACMENEAQAEISRMYAGNEGLYRLSYLEKTAELSETTLNQYLALFDKSHVIKQGISGSEKQSGTVTNK